MVASYSWLISGVLTGYPVAVGELTLKMGSGSEQEPPPFLAGEVSHRASMGGLTGMVD